MLLKLSHRFSCLRVRGFAFSNSLCLHLYGRSHNYGRRHAYVLNRKYRSICIQFLIGLFSYYKTSICFSFPNKTFINQNQREKLTWTGLVGAFSSSEGFGIELSSIAIFTSVVLVVDVVEVTFAFPPLLSLSSLNHLEHKELVELVPQNISHFSHNILSSVLAWS